MLASLLSALPHAAIDVTVPLERIQEAEERAVVREQARSQVEQVRADLARARAEYRSASDLARLLRPVEHAPVLAVVSELGVERAAVLRNRRGCHRTRDGDGEAERS